MNASSAIQSFVEKHLGDTPYCIWLRNTREKKLRIIHSRKGLTAPPPPDDSPSLSETYSIIRADRYIHMTFTGEEGFLAAVTVPGNSCPLSTERLEHLATLFHLYSCQEQLREKNLELVKLLEGIRSITASLDPDELIKKIIGNALTVITGADAGLLHLYDPGIDRLVPKAAVGFDEKAIRHFQLKIGESIAGKVFQDGRARLYRSTPEAHEGMSDISRENYDRLNAAKELSNLKGLLCVPISIGQERIGVLVLHQFHREGNLSERDLELLQGFADQTAIAIQNARLYTETKNALRELEKVSEQLRKKHEFLLKRNDVHETLTRLSLQNKGTKAIVTALNRMIGKPVYLIDYLENKYYPEEAKTAITLSADEAAKLFSERHQPVFLDVFTDRRTGSAHAGMRKYFVYPIFNRTVFLGCLIVDTRGTTLSDLDHIAIEQGGSVLALELVKKQTISSVFYKKTHEFFQELLQNKDRDVLIERGKEWGLDSSTTYSVVLAKFTPHPDLQKLDAAVHRLVAKVKQQWRTAVQLVYGFHNQVTILVAISPRTPLDAIKQMCRTLLKEWEWKDSSPLCVGIGTPYEGIERIHKSYEEANKAATYLVKRKQGGVVLFSELGINRLFVNQSPIEIESFVHDVFQALWADKRNGRELEKTLFAYLASNRSVQKTAKKLHIHINTLYQRLRKIETLLKISFDNPEDVLKVQLACHLMEAYGIVRNR